MNFGVKGDNIAYVFSVSMNKSIVELSHFLQFEDCYKDKLTNWSIQFCNYSCK